MYSSPMSSTSGDFKNAGFGGKISRLFRPRADSGNQQEKHSTGHSKWSFGVLNVPDAVEVPGSVLLLAADRNEPLGLRTMDERASHSSIPVGFPMDTPLTPGGSFFLSSQEAAPQIQTRNDGQKKTEDGAIILDPQPEDSANDPLNWPGWRRDIALLSLGFFCMIVGGMSPILAAGFTDISRDLDVKIESVSLSVGLYMLGLGLGSIIASPTAILYGKRPVYLASVILLIATCVWAGYASSFASLLTARFFQGLAISPAECLPSATISEIFFLHERAYRIGIYALLLLGGKNLVPLVSAAIIGQYGWRWVFFIIAMVAGLSFVCLFLFVPETFWDRTPSRRRSSRPSFFRRLSSRYGIRAPRPSMHSVKAAELPEPPHSPDGGATRRRDRHVGFAADISAAADTRHQSIIHEDYADTPQQSQPPQFGSTTHRVGFTDAASPGDASTIHPIATESKQDNSLVKTTSLKREESVEVVELGHATLDPNITFSHIQYGQADIRSRSPINVPSHSPGPGTPAGQQLASFPGVTGDDINVCGFSNGPNLDNERIPASALRGPPKIRAYTHNLRRQPAKTFTQQLKPFHGRLNNDKWVKVMIRPFILFSHPAVLWSAAVHACSIGWLMVISETMAIIYRNRTTYNFDALQTGLVYVSPFIGGVLGTGVAGKVSDLIVRAMARRNGGLYEPEFRLVMAIPITITTLIGLMGFGWSAQEKDHWIVPTIFFGILSFGCSLGSATAMTFCVDSYRQYAGEALVTLNFSKNILHGLVFSLFVARWMTSDGPKNVYIWLGVIQLLVLLTSVPMFIYGKRARMWTYRKNFMGKF